MMRVLNRAGIVTMAALAVVLMWASPRGARAEDPIPSEVDVSDVPGYIATWKVVLEVMGFKIEMFLDIADVDGKVGATLDSLRQPEPLAIAQILKSEDGGLVMNSELVFGGSFRIDITLKTKLEGDKLHGTLKDKAGLFNGEFEAEKMTTEELDSVQGRRPPPTEARMRVDGKIVRIAFANLSTETADWKLFQELKEGEVHSYKLSRATKLYTDFDLEFGDVVIKKENVAKDYPGVYSLWLKRVGDGWSLVFNDEPDIHGTRRIAAHDVAEVPLIVSEVEGEPQAKFLVTLEPKGEKGGVMTMVWGNLMWTSDFTVIP